MMRPRTADGGKSRPPMGGVRRCSVEGGQADGDEYGENERAARRRDAEGVRPRGPPRTPVPVASTGGREPAPCHTDFTLVAVTDFSSSAIFECAPVTTGT